MKSTTGPVAWLIYIASRTVFAIMQCFPIDWNLRTAKLLARLWRLLSKRHFERAREHLRASVGHQLSESQLDAAAHRCLENVVMFAVEVVCLPRIVNQFTWPRFVRLVNFDDGLRVLLYGKGAILVTGHYGSFELTGHLLACLGFDVVAVMRPLDNTYLNRYLVASRRTHGLRLLDKKGAMTEAEQLLDDGYLLGFIGDQDAGRKGMFVDFFGQPASTYKSIGLLAMAKEVPIIVGYVRRLEDASRYDLGVQRIIYPHEWAERPDPLRWITQEYTAAIEAFVRDAPEQYLWIHRRWKSKPRVRAVRSIDERGVDSVAEIE